MTEIANIDRLRLTAAVTKEELEALLSEAETRCGLSDRALMTHGHQRSTWGLAGLDAAFREAAREKLRLFNDADPTPTPSSEPV